jgi:hypothetical protein
MVADTDKGRMIGAGEDEIFIFSPIDGPRAVHGGSPWFSGSWWFELVRRGFNVVP